MSGTRRPTLGGIIPARAGFTTGTRSRCRRRCGSSPLARGLPPAKTAENMPRRIIPARAGFTRRSDPYRRRSADHPRSRGVYGAHPATGPAPAGSSPLARGLPPPVHGRCRVGGIIPARAGFTPSPCPCAGPPWDHPRSRGVYSSTGPSRPPSAGSSPLARGLQPEQRAHGRHLGIIPARAGFTG